MATLVVRGDCNETIDQVVSEIPTEGLNVALIDPFNLAALSFATIGKLATFKRMDLIVFFPIGEIRRNLEQNRATYTTYLDRALGTADWQAIVKTKREATKLIGVFRQQLQERFSYTAQQVGQPPSEPRRTSRSITSSSCRSIRVGTRFGRA